MSKDNLIVPMGGAGGGAGEVVAATAVGGAGESEA